MHHHVGSTIVVTIGLASLAAAMGIGRFAFTPLMPLMQETLGLSLVQGTWLATANYAGYFIGALSTFLLAPRAGAWSRWGLLTVAGSTAAMGLTSSFGIWLALRFVAGTGSAFVLVGVSSWALAHLASNDKLHASGVVFSGVGIGVMASGVVALVAGIVHADPAALWILLGALCAAVAVAGWKPLHVMTSAAKAQDQDTRMAAPLNRAEWTLVACYGAFGFGYIIPATFIPAAARALVNDPAIFGWTWPAFGLAAAASTVAVSALFRRTPPRRVLAWSFVVMAAGVVVPVIESSVASLVVSALCVGGTFVVVVMAAAQEARRIASGSSMKLIAALTATFAIGQIAGPALVGIGNATAGAVAGTSVLAAAALVLSAIVLSLTGARKARVAA